MEGLSDMKIADYGDLQLPSGDWFERHFQNLCPPDPLQLPSGDWFERHFQNLCPPDPFVKWWNLNWNCWIILYCEPKGVRLHIREYVEKLNYVPTRKGVVLTPGTWYDFSTKIVRFNDLYNEASFIANNQLIVMSDNRRCNMQQLFKEGERFTLKQSNISFMSDQVDLIIEKINDVSASMLSCIYNQHLSQLMLISKPENCLHNIHSSKEEMRIRILQAVSREVRMKVSKFFICIECIHDYSPQRSHTCTTTSGRIQYQSVGEKALFNANIQIIVENVVKEGCCCCCTDELLSELCLEEYKKYIEQQYN